MTVSTAPSPLSYSGNGSTVAFPITWKYNAKSHIVATLRSSTGTETTWALTTNYTLTDPGDTGTLTAVVAPASGETLVISLEPPNTQSSDIPLGGEFPSVTVEDGLDLAAQRDQKIQSLFDRSLRVPRTDTKTGSALELPIDTSRAGKYLAFNADGGPIASAAAAGTAVVSTFMATVLDDTTAAAARTTLGASQDSTVVHLAGTETITGDKTHSGTVTMSGKSIIDANASVAAHATTMDPWSLGNYVTLTGAAVTFTALTAAPQAGAEVEIYMNAAHTFTNGAVFEVDGNANWTAVIGSRVRMRAKSTTVFTVQPIKEDGTAVAGGKILQVVHLDTGAVASGTTVLPSDDTIPQNTEGDEYMQLAITPLNASSTLVIDVVFNGTLSIAESSNIALFRDTTAGAIGAVSHKNQDTNIADPTTFSVKAAAVSTTATTFKVRAGPGSAATQTFNGAVGARKFGGVMSSSIRITEIGP